MIGMDLASLMSSVSGLKASPRMAICLSFNSPNSFLAFSTACCAWFSLTCWVACSRVGL